MISANGEKIKYKFGFEPFSADCDYKKMVHINVFLL